MPFLIPFIIIVEIIGGIMLTSPNNKLVQEKNKINYKNVLGEEDNATPTPETQPSTDESSQPAPVESNPTSTPTSPETTAAPPETTPSINPNISGNSENLTITPSETTAPTGEETPQETQTPANASITVTGTSSESPSPSPIQAELESEKDQQKTTVKELNNAIENQESSLYNNMDEKSAVESVSKENKEELDGENNQVEQAKTPLDKAQLLVQFGDKDVQHMNVEAQNNNLDEVVFHAEKFTYQLDKALDTIQTLPPDQAEKVKENVALLCKSADTALRQQELVVGEVDAQSLETARGTCFDYTYGP